MTLFEEIRVTVEREGLSALCQIAGLREWGIEYYRPHPGQMVARLESPRGRRFVVAPNGRIWDASDYERA